MKNEDLVFQRMIAQVERLSDAWTNLTPAERMARLDELEKTRSEIQEILSKKEQLILNLRKQLVGQC